MEKDWETDNVRGNEMSVAWFITSVCVILELDNERLQVAPRLDLLDIITQSEKNFFLSKEID